jgi:hypothetical protein
MMKLAAQKYIELKSEHFGKNSMSIFGGEFIRRLLKVLEGTTLAPFAEVDETACDSGHRGRCKERNLIWARGTES